MAGRMMTMGELRKGGAGGGKKGDDDEDKKKKNNTLYTGGALSGSGQNVIGPSRDEEDDEDDDEDGEGVVGRIFKQKGVGEAGARGAVVIRFWRNAVFTVDDGEARAMDDPANKAFLAALDNGAVPPELQAMLTARGVPPGDVDVSVEDHRGEDYVAPAYRAFSGTGGSLRAAPGAGAGTAGGAVVAPSGAGTPPVLDAGAPSTTLAVRLLDGRRERLVMNLGATVGGLQAAVAALGGHGSRPFMLVAGFPPRPLADRSATLEAAGLRGAAVTQTAA